MSSRRLRRRNFTCSAPPPPQIVVHRGNDEPVGEGEELPGLFLKTAFDCAAARTGEILVEAGLDDRMLSEAEVLGMKVPLLLGQEGEEDKPAYQAARVKGRGNRCSRSLSVKEA